MTARMVVAALAAALAVGCAGQGTEAQSASAQTKASPSRYTPPEDPYPSTYRPYPGVLTAITGATIFDGEGG
ncbi:MAG TPA: amidohydrolase, partial [Allosphingosinicella sp.]|nr:amidohydrolase [Allosphingosinicella sp.]